MGHNMNEEYAVIDDDFEEDIKRLRADNKALRGDIKDLTGDLKLARATIAELRHDDTLDIARQERINAVVRNEELLSAVVDKIERYDGSLSMKQLAKELGVPQRAITALISKSSLVFNRNTGEVTNG